MDRLPRSFLFCGWINFLRRGVLAATGSLLEENKSQTLDAAWDQSSRRRSTLASFTMQALALSLLLAIALLWVQGPPRLRGSTRASFLRDSAPAAPPPPNMQRAKHPLEVSGDIALVPSDHCSWHCAD
jgi:hypothetical protein